MRKLIVSEYITINGVMEDPGGGDGSPYGGWSFPYWNNEAEKFKYTELFNSDALLLGRITYQGFAEAWPSMTDETGFASRMNSMTKYVVSTTLSEPLWNNSIVLKTNILKEIIRLKEQDGKNILVFGSSQLVSLLQENDLVDEYRLMIHPVIVGKGKKLFEQSIPKSVLRLEEVIQFKSGIIVLTYSRN